MIVPVVLAVALAVPTTVTRKVATVALVTAQPEVPTHWREALQRVVIEDEMRAWVPPPVMSLDDVRAALGCAAWDDPCAGQVTAMSGAAAGLVVDIAGSGAGITVTVRAVRADGTAERSAETLSLDARGADALELARQFVRAASRGPVAFLTVEADEVGAEVAVDGTSVGSAPVRMALTPGAHQLVVRKEGKAPLSRPLSLVAGQNPPLVLTFNAAGPSVALGATVGGGPQSADGRVDDVAALRVPRNATIGWTLTGIGGAALAAGAFVGVPWLIAYFDTDVCGGGQLCYPNPIQVYGGALKYADSERRRFYTDAATALSAATALGGIGAVVAGTGLLVALVPEDGAAPAAAEAPASAPSPAPDEPASSAAVQGAP